MLRPLTAFHKDLQKIFSQRLAQDHPLQGPEKISPGSLQDLPTRNYKKPWSGSSCHDPKRSSQDRDERTCCCWRGSWKIFIQEPSKSLSQELSYKHRYYVASPRSSCKDLLGRTSPGSPDLLLRTRARSCKDLLRRISPGSPQLLLIRTRARLCKDLLRDVSKIFTGSSH